MTRRGHFLSLQRAAYDPGCSPAERATIIRVFFPSHDPEELSQRLDELNEMRRAGQGLEANALLAEIAEAP